MGAQPEHLRAVGHRQALAQPSRASAIAAEANCSYTYLPPLRRPAATSSMPAATKRRLQAADADTTCGFESARVSVPSHSYLTPSAVAIAIAAMVLAVGVGALGNLLGAAIRGAIVVWDVSLNQCLYYVLGIVLSC